MTELLHAVATSGAMFRLGWTLLHSLWIAAAVAAILALLLAILRHTKAHIRYALSCAAFAAIPAAMICAFLLTPAPTPTPILTPPAPTRAPTPQTITPLPPAPLTIAPPTAPIKPAPSPITVPQSPTPIAPIAPILSHSQPLTQRIENSLAALIPTINLAWAAGVALLSLWQLLAWRTARRLRTVSVHTVEPALLQLLQRLQSRLHINRPVTVLHSLLAKVPLTLGFLKPVILLPAALAASLSPEQLEMILLHELAHIRRHDYLINLLQTLLETLLFYHPAVWFISRRIREERENCCDDIVLQITKSPDQYAEALLACTGQSTQLTLAATGAKLLPRLRRILGVSGETSPRRTLLSAALALAVVAAMIGIPLACSTGKPFNPKSLVRAKITLLLGDDGQSIPQNPSAIPEITDAHAIATLASFFPEMGQGEKSPMTAGWIGDVNIQFFRADGRTISLIVSAHDDYWSEGHGDWQVRGDLKTYLKILCAAAHPPESATTQPATAPAPSDLVVPQNQPINVLGLHGRLGQSFAVGAGVYLVTVAKTQTQGTTPGGAVFGEVTVRVRTTFMGRKAESLVLPFSTSATAAGPWKDSAFANWARPPVPGAELLIVVVPHGTDGNIRPALPDGAASEVWEIKRADDPVLTKIKEAVALWGLKDTDIQIKQAGAALTGTDRLLRSVGAYVLAGRLTRKPNETLDALRGEITSLDAGKTELGFDECITLSASLLSLANSAAVGQEIRDSALRTLVGFVLVSDSQVSATALAYLATAVGRGDAKPSSTDLLSKEEVMSLRKVIAHNLGGGGTNTAVPTLQFANQVAKWAGVTPATRPATAPATQPAATTVKAAREELQAVFDKAIAECRAVTEHGLSQQALVEKPSAIETKWPPSALPELIPDQAPPRYLSRCPEMETLATQINQQSQQKMTPELHAYAAAAGEFLKDADPARRGLACAFLGLLGPHAVEAGMTPELAAKLSDNAVAVKGVVDRPHRQQADVGPAARAAAPQNTADLTVADLAQMSLAACTNWQFTDPATFQEWWKANGDYQSRLWYWALRWARQDHVNQDLPALFAQNPQRALSIVILAASYNNLENEGHQPWPDLRPAGNRQLPQSVGSLYFAPDPTVIAALVTKYHLREQLLQMAAGDFTWREKISEYDRENLAVNRVTPILAAASTRADVPQIRALLKSGKGLTATSAQLQVALARVSEALDPTNAPAILLDQLARHPALPSLAADLIAHTGVQHWETIKASYTAAPAGNDAGSAALIAALAALKPAEARPRLAELLIADPLPVTLDEHGNPTHENREKELRFRAMVKAAHDLNAGKPVLDDTTVTNACAYIRFKVPESNMPAFLNRNHAAIANHQQAVRNLLAFFQGAKSAATPPAAWKEIDAKMFAFQAPPDIKLAPSGKGVDSYIGEYKGDSISLSFDYGMYSNRLEPREYQTYPGYAAHEESIHGKDARIISYQKTPAGLPPEYVAAIHIPEANGKTISLTIYATCKTQDARNTALKIFKTITFPATPPPAGKMGPGATIDPPPPESPPQPTLTPKAAKILKELTAENNATLDIDLHWRWDQQPNGPHCISIDLESGGGGTGDGILREHVAVTPERQRQLLQFLAQRGLLDHALDQKAGGDAWLNARTMGYFMLLIGPHQTYWIELGCDTHTLSELQAIRGQLDGEAAKAMDKLLAAFAPAVQPTWNDFQKLLNQPFDSPAVKTFAERYHLKQYHKFDSGGFEDYEHSSFSLLYRANHISRVILTISREKGDPFPQAPIYAGTLPKGVNPDDSPEKVIHRLGPPTHQPERDVLNYDKLGLTFSLNRTTHKLLEIDIDPPHAPPSTAPSATRSNSMRGGPNGSQGQDDAATQNYPTAITKNAWPAYTAGIAELLKGAPREKMAPVFAAIPDPYAQEIGRLMQTMVDEDKHYVAPADPAKLSEKDRLAWLIHQLRDVAATDIFIPGKVHVLEFAQENSPALQLRKMGKKAVPTLIALLNDRRPTRSSGALLNGARLLRNCDVALEILEAISGQIFDNRTYRGAYLSTATPEDRAKIIERVQAWWQKNQGLTETQWIEQLLEKDGVGNYGQHIPLAQRLVELQGKAAVPLLRQCVAKNPEIPSLLGLLWQAGGKDTLEDLRHATKSPNVEVRGYAYSLLITAGQHEYIALAANDLAHVIAHPTQNYKGQGMDKEFTPLIDGLAWSGNQQAILTAAKYMANPDDDVAWNAVQAVLQSRRIWQPTHPTLFGKLTPDLMAYLNLHPHGPMENMLEYRFSIATTIVRDNKIPADWPEKMPTPEVQAQKIQQLEAWWKQHAPANNPPNQQNTGANAAPILPPYTDKQALKFAAKLPNIKYPTTIEAACKTLGIDRSLLKCSEQAYVAGLVRFSTVAQLSPAYYITFEHHLQWPLDTIHSTTIAKMLTTAQPAAADAPQKPTDDELFSHAACIVMGKLSDHVTQDAAGGKSAVIENIKPLLMDILPGEVWPGSRPNDDTYLHLTPEDTFKPGDEGMWILQKTARGYVAGGPGHFRPAREMQASLEALDKWMRAQAQSQIKTTLATLRKDPDGDAEATWKSARELAILLECENASPLYKDKPDENPFRVQLHEFYAALGLDLPVAPNPKTAEEIKRATPVLKHLLYVGTILDHPDDPGYHASFEQTLASYWHGALHRLESTLAANPSELASHIAMLKRVATKESLAREFPPGTKETRMLVFWGGLPKGGHGAANVPATQPALASPPPITGTLGKPNDPNVAAHPATPASSSSAPTPAGINSKKNSPTSPSPPTPSPSK